MHPSLDAEGIFRGRKVRRCSDESRMLYPYMLLYANGYGRFECDPEVMRAQMFLGFDAPPTDGQIYSALADYHVNGLATLYEVDQTLWCDLRVPSKNLPNYKTSSDRRSPRPPDENAELTDSRAFGKFSKTFEKFSHVVVGVVRDVVNTPPIPPQGGNARKSPEKPEEPEGFAEWYELMRKAAPGMDHVRGPARKAWNRHIEHRSKLRTSENRERVMENTQAYWDHWEATSCPADRRKTAHRFLSDGVWESKPEKPISEEPSRRVIGRDERTGQVIYG